MKQSIEVWMVDWFQPNFVDEKGLIHRIDRKRITSTQNKDVLRAKDICQFSVLQQCIHRRFSGREMNSDNFLNWVPRWNLFFSTLLGKIGIKQTYSVGIFSGSSNQTWVPFWWGVSGRETDYEILSSGWVVESELNQLLFQFSLYILWLSGWSLASDIW